MQSIFRLPWCSDQLKLSDKPACDKVRPVVEIPPVLAHLKRKHSSDDDHHLQFVSPLKKQRAESEYPQQLLTPNSPYVDFAIPRDFERVGAQQLADSCSTSASASPVHSRSGSHLAQSVTADASPASACAASYFTAKPHAEAPSTPMANPSLAAPDPLSGLTPLQQAIENEFNMQILMKHNELRLVEQELAKCQVALEQLRRCELRPFPGAIGIDPSISTGTGPALEPRPGFSRPTHPAPHGVADGPYSRHYARWLLNDSRFDSLSAQSLARLDHAPDSAKPSTRNAGHVRKSVSKSVGVGTRHSESLQSIPNYPPSASARDKTPFQVLRRSTDNQLVKLICKDCKRGNFSSIQGFLNHCRIAHKVDYKSHDAAAIDCGQLLEEQELASLPPETHAVAAPKPKPTPQRISHNNSSNAATAHTASHRHQVHPLNTSTDLPTPIRTAPSTPVIPVPTPKIEHANSEFSCDSPFKPSHDAPRLSAFFAKHGLGGDLEHAMAMAQQKIDLGADDEVDSPDTSDTGSPLVPFAPGARTVAGGKQLGVPPSTTVDPCPRPPSRKGHRQPAQRSRPSPLSAPVPPGSGDLHRRQSSAFSSPQDPPSTIHSPRMAESNPGLVSDHEDDDHGSASDEDSAMVEVRHPLPPPVGRSCEDHMDLDVQDDDEMDQHGVIIRRNSMVAADAREIRSSGGSCRKMGGS